MATINILVAVDGAALAQQVADKSIQPGTQAAPTSLGAWSTSNVYIAMIAPSASISNGSQGQSELQVDANSGDIIEWAITTFDNNFDQTPYLYASTFNIPAAISSPLSYDSSEGYAYLSTSNPPTSTLTKFINQVNTVSGQIKQVGVTIQYTLSFALVNNQNGTIIGYFSWDPFIKVA